MRTMPLRRLLIIARTYYDRDQTIPMDVAEALADNGVILSSLHDRWSEASA